MKRTLALILALVMVLPASFISALAHGPGVAMNDYTNQSIHNAVNQPLPETVTVDGKYDDTAWDKDEWYTVNKRTGTWDTNAPEDVNYSYKYQIKMDGDYLYGVFSLNSGTSEITVWLNEDQETNDKATDTIVIGLNGTSVTSYTINGAAPSNANGTDSKYPAEQFQIKSAADTVEKGKVVVEFRAYRKAFANTDSITYFVAAEKSGSKLYYPVIAVNGVTTPKTPDEQWPANAIVITRRDILDANADHHLPISSALNESQHNVIIDGRLEEPVWANLSDYRESDKTSHQFVVSGDNDTVGPIDLTLKNGTTTGYSVNHGQPNSLHYHTGGNYACSCFAESDGNNGIKFKYDLRTDGTYLYGAVSVYDKAGNADHYIADTDVVNGSSMTWADWKEKYASTTYLNVNFYTAGRASQPVIGQLQIKCDGSYQNSSASTYHIYSGNSAYATKFEEAEELFSDNTRDAGAIRMNGEIVTFEFKVPLKYLNDGSTAPDSFELAIEAFEGVAVDEGDNDGSNANYGTVTVPSGSYRPYDAYASTDYLTVNKKTHAAVNLNANGGLTDAEWGNLVATDYYIKGSYKTTARDNGNVLSFKQEVVADHDYIYGSSVILLNSKIKNADPTKTAGEASTATTYRLWLNDQGENSSFTEVISFYLGEDGDTRVMVSDGANAAKTNHTYYVKGSDGYFREYKYGSNSTTTMTATGETAYGLEAVIRTVTAAECDAEYIARYPDMYAAISNGYVVVVEYKIPLDMARTDMPIHQNEATETTVFTYHISVEDGWNTGKGLCTECDDKLNSTSYRTFSPGTWDHSTSSYFYASQAFDTFEADGMRTEFYWNSFEDYIGVNGSTGYYIPEQTTNNTYAFGQTVYVGYNNLYGYVILDDEAVAGKTEFTLWINADPAQNGYTHRFHFTEENKQFVCNAYTKDGTALTFDKYTGVQVVGNTINGRTSIEFMIDLDLFDEDKSGFEYTVSSLHEVNGEELGLYYPATDTFDKLFVTHINAADVTARAGMIYSYENRNKINGWSNYFVFNPTGTANEYTVACAVGPTGDAAKNAVLAAIKEGGFIYSPYNTLYYSVYDYGDAATDETRATMAAWKSVYGQGYLDDCFAQFTVGATVEFRGLDTSKTVDPGNVKSIIDSVYGYEPEAQNITFSVEKVDADDRNVNLPDNDVWYSTALAVDTLGYFYPEIITVDGNLGDSGWDPNGWTEVFENMNGSLQAENYEANGASHYNYKYQMRTDGENVYFAFVLYDVNFAGTYGNGVDNSEKTFKFCPSVRVWIKSKADEYKGAVSFTHLYDVRYGIPSSEVGNYTGNGSDYLETTLSIDKIDIHGQYHAGQEWYLTNTDEKNIAGVPADQTDVTSYSNADKKVTYINTQLRFAEHLPSATGGYLFPWGGNADRTNALASITDSSVKYPATTQNQGYSDSLLFGETVEIMENTTSGTHGDDSQWYAWTDTERYELAKEHGRWFYDDNDGHSYVEFKFNLSEIGCGNGEEFEYFVHGAFSGEKYDAPFTMFNPTVTNIPYGNEKGFTSYSLPFWNFDEVTSLKYNSSTEYSHMLRNNYGPAVSLGAKVSDDTDGNGTNAIRFGGLYTEDYIRRKAHEVTNNYKDGYDAGSGRDGDRVLNGANMDGITNYWDVAKVGIVFQFTQKLGLDADGNVDLTLDTAGAGSADSVGIYQWNKNPGSNFADYEKYVFYVTLNGMPDAYKKVKFSFRSYVDYYDADGSPTYYDQILERSWNQINDGVYTLPEEGADVGDGNQGGNGNPGADIIKNYNGATIAYIPLDNRPVNIDRAIYLAQSAGFEIILPPEDYYVTEINTADTAEDDSRVGNPEKLYEWLQANENVADYYVISLDQLLSGGLVGSRDFAGVNKLPDADTDGAYYDPDLAFEEEVIDYLAELVQKKEVVFFDSQMRLASTGQFNGFLSDNTTIDGYNVNHYTFLRSYFALEERPTVDVTASDALEQIFANYQKNANGNYILNENIYKADGETLNVSANKYYTLGGYSLTAEYLDRYLKSRERKMKLSEMLFDKGVVANSKLFYVGIDDSYPKASIHTAETAWLNYKGAHLDNFEVFAGIDEIGLMSLSAFVTSCYGKVNAVIDYFGPGKDLAADDYGVETLDESIKIHVEGAGARVITPTGTKNYLNVLVLTKETGTDTNGTYIQALINKAKSNIEAGIPTCIVDCSEAMRTLGVALVNSDVELSKLLGYSNWNTVANAAGLSISPAISRFTYLKNSDEITYESHVGAFKQMSYSLIKDIAYTNKWKAQWPSYKGTGDIEANRIACAAASDSFTEWKDKIILDINGGTSTNASVMTSVGEYTELGQIKFVGSLYWPWHRAFEASFDLGFKGATNIALASNGTTITFEEPYSEVFYNASLNDGSLKTSDFGSGMYNADTWWSTAPYYSTTDNVCEVTLTFNEIKNVSMVNFHMLDLGSGHAEGGSGICRPDKIEIYSVDGSNEIYLSTIDFDPNTSNTVTAIWAPTYFEPVATQQIVIKFYRQGGAFNHVDEIQVW